MELRIRTNLTQPSQAVTVKFGEAALAPAQKLNPLRDSFNRLDEAEQLRQGGKLDQAQKICQDLLSHYPHYWGALHTLGLIFIDKGAPDQALNYLVRAAMLDPRSWATLTGLGSVYQALGAYEMAARTLEQAHALNPQDATVLSMLGNVYLEERECELARDAFRQALALDSGLVPTAIGLGQVCSYMGDNAEAIEVFEGLIKRGAVFLDVLAGLAQLPSKMVNVDVLPQLDRVVRQPSEDQAELASMAAFVRVAELDRTGRYAESWKEAVPANRAIFSAHSEELRRERERRHEILTWLRRLPVRGAPANDDTRRPISLFILGPSRSGKTMMERLVGTLEGVKRGYENPAVDVAIRRAFQRAGLLTNSYFELLPEHLHPDCRDIYLDELARRAPSAKVFTNTNPSRVYDAGFISEILPNSRFICVKRNVEDTTLRIFQSRYKHGNFYSYDLEAARDHVAWYQQMMDVLAEKRPGVVRIIHYEDMVAEPAVALRAAAELCGLPAPTEPAPDVGDDRGCAEPYREFMAAELKG
jgi:tetratricopeptide (TPR) repeat protein